MTFLKKNIFSVFFFLSCFLCLPGYSQNIDINLLKAINPQHPDSKFWNATSNSYILISGAATFGSLAYGLIKSDRDIQMHALETMGAIGIDVVLTYGFKKICNRPRPSEKYPNDIFVLKPGDGKSFPSGHTSVAFATATSFTLAYKKWWVAVPAYLWAGCVGYSRMYLGQHYPSDVLGGAIIGAGSSLLSHWLNKKIFKQDLKNTDR